MKGYIIYSDVYNAGPFFLGSPIRNLRGISDLTIDGTATEMTARRC